MGAATCAVRREDLTPQRELVVYPGLEPFPLGNAVQAMPLAALCAELKQA